MPIIQKKLGLDVVSQISPMCLSYICKNLPLTSNDWFNYFILSSISDNLVTWFILLVELFFPLRFLWGLMSFSFPELFCLGFPYVSMFTEFYFYISCWLFYFIQSLCLFSCIIIMMLSWLNVIIIIVLIFCLKVLLHHFH